MVLLKVLLVRHLMQGSFVVGGFSTFLGVQNSLIAKFIGVILALEETHKMEIFFVWLECGSSLVCSTFRYRTHVPWFFRNKWNKCFIYFTSITFQVSHIFREGNHCVDKLVTLGLLI